MKRSPSELNAPAILLLVVAASTLTLWQHRAHRAGGVSPPVRIAKAVAWPLESAISSLVGSPSEITPPSTPSHLEEEIRRLHRRVEELEGEVHLLQQYRSELQALEKSIGLPLTQDPNHIPARIASNMNIGPSSARITIEVASPGLVNVDDVVVQKAGLVGKVVEVRDKLAEVMLLVDPKAGVAGLDARSRDQGIVAPLESGTSSATKLRMSKLTPVADLREGDVIVTSGTDLVYPRNLRIGQIERVEKTTASAEPITAIIKPSVDFFRLEYVYVVKTK
jgi:rod shape-determining protein MreC